MNKNIRRKLILSAITLGVAGFATTATTYAWFTSNSTVKTNEVTGTVASDNSIYVKSNLDTAYGSTATISTEGITFKPVQTANGKAFTFKDGASAASTADYLEFVLTFTGEADTHVYMTGVNITRKSSVSSFSLKADAYTKPDNWDAFIAWIGTSANQTEKTDVATDYSTLVLAYNSANSTAKVDVDEGTKYLSTLRGKTLDVDVVDALHMSINVGDDTATPTVYKYSKDFEDANYDSLTYYNNVLGTSISRPNSGLATINSKALSTVSTTSDTAIDFGQIPSSSSHELKVTFRLYLDGWDQECFDAITSQTFKAQFSFASSVTTGA